jgi:hypothetical protein
MAIAWVESVRDTGELTVFTGKSISNTPWANVLPAAVKEFNVFNKSFGLGISLRTVSDPPTDTGGANVKIEAASGSISAAWSGSSKAENFNGKSLHGRTFQFHYENSGLEKAFVFLPLEPHINTPKGQRLVGTGVMRLIAVHEFVHACGLEDSDHVAGGLFEGNPSVDYGKTADLDRVIASAGGTTRKMPPLVLGEKTIERIKLLWPKARKK